MKFTEPLKKTWQFRNVYGQGKSKADKNLVVYSLENGTSLNKLGFSISKKACGNSVSRNKIKRLIKENYRLLESDLKKGFDFVIIARQPVTQATFYQVKSSLENIFSRLDLL